MVFAAGGRSFVFPTCAGMSRAYALFGFDSIGFPRMCGGEPFIARLAKDLGAFSPYVWG